MLQVIVLTSYSQCLPQWLLDLVRDFPFLFPFDLRYNYLQSTSFGYARNITRHANVAAQNRGDGGSSRASNSMLDLSLIARIDRRKVRIGRTQLLESARKVFEMFGEGPYALEVEYFDEAGTGLGPTLEFYSTAATEFARRRLEIWRDEDETKAGLYVHHPKGLFPSPLVWKETQTGKAA